MKSPVPPPAAAGKLTALGKLIPWCVAGITALLCCLACSPALAASLEPSSVYASEVSADSATLHARILPEGAQTSYVLEYGPSKYESPVPPAGSKQVDAGETSAAAAVVPVEVHLQNLPASTTFYYRVVAGGVDSQESTSFTTDPEGSEFALPDGRAWELVSPPDKYGGSLEAITHEGGVIQASENGSAITYVSVNPIVGDPLGNRALEDTQLMSRRGATGWSTEDIATPHNDVGVFKLGEPAEYKFFSPDLSLGLVEPKGETPLPPLPEGFFDRYKLPAH